jgi:hypothetical protein
MKPRRGAIKVGPVPRDDGLTRSKPRRREKEVSENRAKEGSSLIECAIVGWPECAQTVRNGEPDAPKYEKGKNVVP